MASAYATLAAEGTYREPYFVSKVEAADGEIIYENNGSAGQQTMPKQVARNVIEAMLGVAPKKKYDLPGREVAAKTGTAQLEGSAKDNRDAWFVGFTPGKATAVWVGSDKSDPIRDSRNQPIFGSGLPGQIWHAFMKTATKNDPPLPFSPFVPMGEPPTDDFTSETSSPDEDEDDENSDSDENRDGDSGNSSDDDSRSSRDDSGSNSSDDNSSNSSNNRSSGSGSDQPTSLDTQDSSTSGTSGSASRGQSDRSAVGRTSDSGPAG
jgi:membrane peptidoglycan carboxypeptidase